MRRFRGPGVFAVIVSVNVWYTSTNQNLIQRILGARSEWDARMGIITAGFIKVITPFVIVVPGIIAFVLYPDLNDSNTAYPVLAREVLPAGLFGLLMAAFTAAIMSTVDSVVNSTSTIITLDFYKRLFKPGTSDHEIVFVGRICSTLVLLVATVGACFIDEASRVFILIQNLFAYIGPPAASVFILGIFWKRANHIAALTTSTGGDPAGRLHRDLRVSGHRVSVSNVLDLDRLHDVDGRHQPVVPETRSGEDPRRHLVVILSFGPAPSRHEPVFVFH